MKRLRFTFAQESFTNFTQRGGLIPLAHFAEKIGFFETFSKLNLKANGIRYSLINKIATIIASVAVGCKHNIQINKKLKGDLPSAQAFGMESFPDQSLINRFLHQFRQPDISALSEIWDSLYRDNNITKRGRRKRITVDFDSTGLVVHGKTYQFARKGYFPNHKGAKGYRLSAAYCGGKTRELIAHFLDPGNWSSAGRFKDLLKKVLELLPRERLILRADAAFGTIDNINHLLNLGVRFIFKGKNGKTAKNLVASIENLNFIEVNKSTKIAELPPKFIPPHFNDKVKIVIIKKQKKKEITYSYLITNIFWANLLALFNFYNARQTIEAFIKQAKNLLSIKYLRTRKISGIKAFLYFAFMAYNLLIWFMRRLKMDLKLISFSLHDFIEEIMNATAYIAEKNKYKELQFKEHSHYLKYLVDKPLMEVA